MKIEPNQTVRVDHPISETEKQLLGRTFVVDRITKPHGYAAISDEHGTWHVHPESLTVLPTQDEV